MSWVRFDDDYANHPKILRAGPLGQALHVRSACWSSHYLTDGFIPDGAVPALVVGLDVYDPRTPAQWAEHMVACGLWDQGAGGFLVHDFRVYNPTKKEVLRSRKAAVQQRIEAGRARARTGKRSGGRYIPPAEGPAGTPSATPPTQPAQTPATYQPPARTRTPAPSPTRTRAAAATSSAPASASAASLEVATVGKNGTAAPTTTPGSVAFSAYAAEYERHYGVPPVRNKVTNSLFKRLAELLGPEAAEVAAFFVRHRGRLYVSSKHDPTLLVRDAAGLRTEWATGRMVTDTEAREADRVQGTGDRYRRIVDRFAEEDRRHGEG